MRAAHQTPIIPRDSIIGISWPSEAPSKDFHQRYKLPSLCTQFPHLHVTKHRPALSRETERAELAWSSQPYTPPVPPPSFFLHNTCSLLAFGEVFPHSHCFFPAPTEVKYQGADTLHAVKKSLPEFLGATTHPCRERHHKAQAWG